MVEALRNRAMPAGPSGLLFASRNDTLLDLHTMRESWSHIREAAGLGWMKPHRLRKTALSKSRTQRPGEIRPLHPFVFGAPGGIRTPNRFLRTELLFR